MRERKQLEDGINSIRTLSQSLEDNIQLTDMDD